MADPEKAYAAGFLDGYRQAKADLQNETDQAINQLNAKTAELNAEAEAVRAVFERLRARDGEVETERDPATRLN